MMRKTGLCSAILCEALAEYCNESGQDNPSTYAVEIARNWEKNINLLLDYIETSHKWCKGTLSWGCINLCKMWTENKWQGLRNETM